LAPQTLKQLRELGVNDEKELKLEFFFYSNTIDKEINLLNGDGQYG
jgi:hypothetical protein